MRIVIDIMIGLMLIAVVAGGLYLYNSNAHDEAQTQTVRAALQRLQKQAAYHTAVQSAVAEQEVLLVHLHREWFGENVPTNVLLDGDRPWIDLAPPGDLGAHPPDPVVLSENQAGFWYNPTTGTFRARVSPAASEALTLALYNEVNGTALPEFETIPDTTRQPMAHVLGETPARQYASMANKTWSEPVIEEDLFATDLITAGQSAVDFPQSPEQHRGVNLVGDPIAEKQSDFITADNPALNTQEASSKTKPRPTLNRSDAK